MTTKKSKGFAPTTKAITPQRKAKLYEDCEPYQKVMSESLTPEPRENKYNIHTDYDFRRYYQDDVTEDEKDAIAYHLEEKYLDYVHFVGLDVLVELEANPFWRVNHTEEERQICIKTEIQRIIDIVAEFPMDNRQKAKAACNLLDNLGVTLREQRTNIDYGFFDTKEYLSTTMVRCKRVRPTFNVPF